MSFTEANVINSRRLNDLLFPVRSRMISFIARAEMALTAAYPDSRWKVIPTSTLRDKAYQAFIYAQGRSAPGPIVTNAKPGDSIHEYGCAMDFAVQQDNGVVWKKQYYDVCGNAAKQEGLTWGGDWNGNGVQDPADWDRCHVQWTGGLTIADLQAGKGIPVA